jgi:hypothetical protein
MLDEDKTLEMVQTLISALPTAEESAQVAESGLVRGTASCRLSSYGAHFWSHLAFVCLPQNDSAQLTDIIN